MVILRGGDLESPPLFKSPSSPVIRNPSLRTDIQHHRREVILELIFVTKTPFIAFPKPSVSRLGILESLFDLAEGLQLHADVIKMGFCCNTFASTALVDMYSKSKGMESARKVFDGMPQRSPMSWTSMAVGYARSGDTDAAMELFTWMPEKDMAAFNAMIDVFVKLGDLGSARRLFDKMQDRNVVSWTSLISGYCKVGDMEVARVLFDEMPERNLYSWNVMNGGYCQNRQPHQSLELFRELLSGSCRFEPNEVTLVSIIPAIADMGAIDLCRWIHSYARRKGLDRGISILTALVDMYAKCGDICEAKRIFDRMPRRETASWNAMINGFE